MHFLKINVILNLTQTNIEDYLHDRKWSYTDKFIIYKVRFLNGCKAQK